MRVLIACDAFKDSLSAEAANQAIAQGWQRARPHDELLLIPMADGGEGSLAVLLSDGQGQAQRCTVEGPLGQPRQAQWGLWPDGLAVIELAEASGIQHLSPAERNALTTSSFGTGQLINAALAAGARALLITLGGSACNDAGAGLLQALGARLLDQHGKPLTRGGAALSQVVSIDLSLMPTTLGEIPIAIACDVDNPLCGPQGASAVFGPQKGASPAEVAQLDSALSHFADVLAQACGRDMRAYPGAGAAGGAAFALLSIAPQATLQAGLSLIAERRQLPAQLKHCDLLITGEGRLDGQSLAGKTPIALARLAQQQGTPCIALCGSLNAEPAELAKHGICAAFSLCNAPMDLATAITNSATLLSQQAENVARLLTLRETFSP